VKRKIVRKICGPVKEGKGWTITEDKEIKACYKANLPLII